LSRGGTLPPASSPSYLSLQLGSQPSTVRGHVRSQYSDVIVSYVIQPDDTHPPLVQPRPLNTRQQRRRQEEDGGPAAGRMYQPNNRVDRARPDDRIGAGRARQQTPVVASSQHEQQQQQQQQRSPAFTDLQARLAAVTARPTACLPKPPKPLPAPPAAAAAANCSR